MKVGEQENIGMKNMFCVGLKKRDSLSFILIGICAFSSIIYASCSSSPKRQMAVTDKYNKTVQVYQSANSYINSGKLLEGGNSLRNAYDQAISIDAKDLLCRICLSSISFGLSAKNQLGTEYGKLFGLQAKAENVLDFDSKTLLLMAEDYARESDSEEELLAACRIYEALIVINEGGSDADYNNCANKLGSVEKLLTKEPYYAAYLQRVRGDLYVLLKNYSHAEKSYLKAIAIHTENRYLDEVGVDWYCLSRSRAKSGDKHGAVKAVEMALKYDKDAENTYAIASDYFARAVILVKEPASASQIADAKKDALWASKIYKSGGFYSEATECQKFAEGLK